MTDSDLDAIFARLANATQAPLEREGFRRPGYCASVRLSGKEGNPDGMFKGDTVAHFERDADADFFIHAATDVRNLVGEVLRLRERCKCVGGA